MTTPCRMVKAGNSSLGITYMAQMPKARNKAVMKAVIL